MRKVLVSDLVLSKAAKLKAYLTVELHLSEEAATRRMDGIGGFINSLSAPADYALCRFEKWRALGYHCAPFEGWVFAYEIFPDGVIVRDMSHGKLLME